MKRWFVLLLLALSGAALALEATLSIKLSQAFALDCCGNGAQTARYQPSGLTIRFLRVSSDSRCPPKVDCVWAGNAALELSVSANKAQKRITLNTGLEPRSAKVFGYTLRLKALEPPNDARPVKAYRATFTLEKTP